MARISSNSVNKRLLERIKGEERLFLPDHTRIHSIPLIIAGSVIFIFALWLSYDFTWSWLKTGLISCLLLFGAFSLVIGVTALLSKLRKEAARGLLITPHIFVVIEKSFFHWYPLVDLVNIDCAHRYKGRAYDHSKISLQFADREFTTFVYDIDAAEDSVDKIVEIKNKALANSASNTSEQVVGLIDDLNKIDQKTPIMQPLLTVTAVMVVAAFGLSSSLLLNEYFDDSLSWQKAEAANKASSYREYIATHPKGRFVPISESRLKTFYDEAEARYRSTIGSEFDEDAVNAVIALLKQAKETHQHKVAVSFERKAEIPADLIDQIKEEFEVKTVIPLGTTFSPERMLEREVLLFTHLRSAFQKVFQDDVLEVVTECPSVCPQFIVKYEISFLDSIYYDVEEKDIPYEDRNWSPGILIQWGLLLKVADDSESYFFDLESAPAEHITYDSASDTFDNHSRTEFDKHSFYNAMVVSAFEDFSAHLVFNLGLGPEPHLEDQKMMDAENGPSKENKILKFEQKQ